MRPFRVLGGRKKSHAAPLPVDSILQVNDPYYRERIKALRAKLESWVEGERHRVLGVTSSVAGEGKTLLAANLALQFAANGRRKVLLVDTDLRKACVSEYFKLAVSPGLCEALAEQRPVAVETVFRNSRHPNLAIVPSGTLAEDPAGLLAGSRFRAFLEFARKRFDVTILDTAPVLPVADTLGLRDQASGFLFVFRVGFTPQKVLRQALDEIGEKNVLGVVLNGVDQQSRRYYEKYYGSYYRRPVKKNVAQRAG